MSLICQTSFISGHNIALLMQCVTSVIDRLFPDICLISEAVLIKSSGLAMMLLPK
jgi:hypothetical protein